MTIWLQVDGVRSGPHAADALRAAYARGEVAAAAMSWQPGEPAWRSLGRRWGGAPRRAPGLALALGVVVFAVVAGVVPWFDLAPLSYPDARTQALAVLVSGVLVLALLAWHLHAGGARARPGAWLAVCLLALLSMPVAALLAVTWKVDLARGVDPDATMTLDGDARVLRIDGAIGAGFVADLEDALARAPALERIDIDSPGGLVADALAAAAIVEERGLRVRAVGECTSACVLLWAAAPARELDVDSYLGVHQPSVAGDLPASWHEESLELQEPASIALLERAGFSPALLARRAETPSDDVAWIDAVELLDEGVRLTVVDAGGAPMTPAQVREALVAASWEKGGAAE